MRQFIPTRPSQMVVILHVMTTYNYPCQFCNWQDKSMTKIRYILSGVGYACHRDIYLAENLSLHTSLQYMHRWLKNLVKNIYWSCSMLLFQSLHWNKYAVSYCFHQFLFLIFHNELQFLYFTLHVHGITYTNIHQCNYMWHLQYNYSINNERASKLFKYFLYNLLIIFSKYCVLLFVLFNMFF